MRDSWHAGDVESLGDYRGMTLSYILPAEAREELLRYLGNKPYREVALGMQALLDLKPLDEEASDQAKLGRSAAADEPVSDG